MEKVLIIGAGPAGYTAAIYAARANLTPLVIAGPLPGGQLMLTSDVENYPGFIDPIPGPELMEAMRQQSERIGAAYNYAQVTEVDLSKPPFKVWTDSDEMIESQTVIVCTGASSRMLDLPGEKELVGKGISTCAVCDGFFYKGKDVLVVGGGDSALEEASYLAKIVNTVTLIHRREKFRGSKVMQDRVLSFKNVTVKWNTAIDEILAAPDGKLKGVILKDLGNGTKSEKSCDGVFVAIGHIPGTELFKKWLDLDEEGYIKVQNGTRTNIPGVFAAGDCVDRVYRQAVTAAGMGCMAALDCERYLSFI